MIRKLFDFFSSYLAIDLGTASTIIYEKGKGIVLNEPSVVAIRRSERGGFEIVSIGKEAKEMLGKTPAGIETIRPLKDGVIADFTLTEMMLKEFIRRVSENRAFFLKKKIIICVPHGVTDVERRAVKDSAQLIAREVYIIEEPMAAAIGAGLPVLEASGNMVVDIGGGTTEVAVISLGGIVTSTSMRVAGDKMDEAIIAHIKKKYNLLIGEKTAEEIKINIGSAYPTGEERTMEVKGRDIVTGIPKTVEVKEDEVRVALEGPLKTIINGIKTTLEKTPPELAGDIVERGIVLTGGGALLRNIDILIKEEIHLPVSIADDPITCVARGSGKVLESPELMRRIVG
jgi:rod shape-determining protein MreB